VISEEKRADKARWASMIRLALDWLPNTNHTGFYVAQVRVCAGPRLVLSCTVPVRRGREAQA